MTTTSAPDPFLRSSVRTDELASDDRADRSGGRDGRQREARAHEGEHKDSGTPVASRAVEDGVPVESPPEPAPGAED